MKFCFLVLLLISSFNFLFGQNIDSTISSNSTRLDSIDAKILKIETELINLKELNYPAKMDSVNTALNESFTLKTKDQTPWYLNILGGLIGAFISAGIALFIFLRQQNNQKLKEKRQRIANAQIAVLNVNEVIKSTEAKLIHLKEYMKSVKKEPEKCGTLKDSGMYQYESFLKNTTYDLFDTLIDLKIKKGTFSNLFIDIDFLKNLFEAIKDDYNKHCSFIISLSNKIVNNYTDCGNIILQFIDLKKAVLNRTANSLHTFFILDYYDKVDDIQSKKIEPDLKFYIDNFYLPLRDDILPNIVEPELLPLAKTVYSSLNMHDQILKKNNSFNEDIQSRIAEIRDTIYRLENFVKEIEPVLSNKAFEIKK